MRYKVTEKSIQQAKEHAEKIHERISNLNIFISLFEKDFWEFISQELDGKIHNLEGFRDANFKMMTEAELKANVAEERAYKMVKDMPKKAVETRDNLMKTHSQLVQGIRDRSARI